MSFYSYQVFALVAEAQCFARAAEVLRLTPSAVSHIISDLEGEFGFSLFVRGRKGTVLTDEGQRILVYVKSILSTQKQLDACSSQIRGASAGLVRLGVIDSVAASWLDSFVDSYHPAHPDVELHIQENSYQRLISGVVSRDLDIAIVSHSAMRSCAAPLQYIPLYDDRIVCVSSTPIQVDRNGFMPVEALKDQPLILLRDGDEVDVDAYLRAHGITANCCHTAVTNTALVTIVRCGFGYAVIPALSLASCNIDGLSIAPLEPLGFRNLGIITQDPKFLAPVVTDMIDCIKSVILNAGN